MRAECIGEVAAAVGRQMSESEIQGIEDGIRRHMRQLARTDPKFRELDQTQRLQAAAAAAMEERIAHANKVAERRASNLLAQARESDRLVARAADMQAMGRKNPHHAAVFERLRQVDSYANGVRNEVLSDVEPALTAVEPRFWGWMQDPERIRAFARAVLDGDTSDPIMARAAKVYMDALESLRLRANSAGTDIGKLDYGYMPQPHDTGTIARAGMDEWVRFITPLLDRGRYVNEAGELIDDAAYNDMLEKAYTTLSTEGLSKQVPGQAGMGSRAARFDDNHRALHFKDADSYLKYNAKFGRGSAIQGIFDHIGMLAKNIGLMEELGANPTSTYRLLRDTAEKADMKRGVHSWAATLDMVWDTLNGSTSQPVSVKLARFFQGARNWTTAAKLGGVMLSSITDAPMLILVARSNGVPLGEAAGALFAGVGKKKKRMAKDLALGMDEVMGEMARWHQDHLAQGFTSNMANTVIKLTLAEAWTNALRRGFSLTMARQLDRMRVKDWGALSVGDRRRLSSGGITEQDWTIYQAAPKSSDGLLSRKGIRAVNGFSDAEVNRATARLLGYLDEEARTAVLAPDLQTRAMLQQGTKAGTVGGELLRSMMLFKSFGMAIVQKHWRRIQNIEEGAGKVAYGAAMMTSLTLFGAVSMTLKDLAAGKDPRDATTKEFWTAAFLQGGGFGIFGDILYTGMGGNSRGGQANWMNLLGPVIGTGLDGVNVARKGVGWAVGDAEDADELSRSFGAEALRFAKSNTPLVNLWYTRAGIEHIWFHDMQEHLSPGYLRKMERRARKEYGQEFWWEPGESLPERAPDLERAIGE